MIINFSVSREFEEVEQFLSKHKNRSRYLCELVQKDIQGKNSEFRLSDEDIQRIAKAVGNSSPAPVQNLHKGKGISLDLREVQAKKTASAFFEIQK